MKEGRALYVNLSYLVEGQEQNKSDRFKVTLNLSRVSEVYCLKKSKYTDTCTHICFHFSPEHVLVLIFSFYGFKNSGAIRFSGNIIFGGRKRMDL